MKNAAQNEPKGTESNSNLNETPCEYEIFYDCISDVASGVSMSNDKLTHPKDLQLVTTGLDDPQKFHEDLEELSRTTQQLLYKFDNAVKRDRRLRDTESERSVPSTKSLILEIHLQFPQNRKGDLSYHSFDSYGQQQGGPPYSGMPRITLKNSQPYEGMPMEVHSCVPGHNERTPQTLSMREAQTYETQANFQQPIGMETRTGEGTFKNTTMPTSCQSLSPAAADSNTIPNVCPFVPTYERNKKMAFPIRDVNTSEDSPRFPVKQEETCMMLEQNMEHCLNETSEIDYCSANEDFQRPLCTTSSTYGDALFAAGANVLEHSRKLFSSISELMNGSQQQQDDCCQFAESFISTVNEKTTLNMACSENVCYLTSTKPAPEPQMEVVCEPLAEPEPKPEPEPKLEPVLEDESELDETASVKQCCGRYASATKLVCANLTSEERLATPNQKQTNTVPKGPCACGDRFNVTSIALPCPCNAQGTLDSECNLPACLIKYGKCRCNCELTDTNTTCCNKAYEENCICSPDDHILYLPRGKQFRLALPQHKDMKLCITCRFSPSPLIDADGQVFCPGNCGCCLCPWQPRESLSNQKIHRHEKLQVCKCRNRGTLFKISPKNSICSQANFFDVCPCRELAEAKHLELYNMEMWNANETLLEKFRGSIYLSDVVELKPPNLPNKRSAHK